MHIHYMTVPQHKNTFHGGHEIYNFGGPFLIHYYYTLSLSDLCLGVEMIFKEIMYFDYITIIATPQQRKPLPQGSRTILVDPSLVIIPIPPLYGRNIADTL